MLNVGVGGRVLVPRVGNRLLDSDCHRRVVLLLGPLPSPNGPIEHFAPLVRAEGRPTEAALAVCGGEQHVRRD